MSQRLNLTLRYMTLADIPQVMVIDRLAFDLPWPERSYEYEIAESPHGYMVVLEAWRGKTIPAWRRWIPGLNGETLVERQIVGYGGLWNITGETHISTIAVHPRARGRGWGEILLAGMIRRSITLPANEVALEVRVSNTRAQNLYRKYEFKTISVKAEYYRNNNEDAYDMRLNLRNKDMRDRFEERYTALLSRHHFEDLYSAAAPQTKQAGKGY